MRGHVQQRGPRSWRLKVFVGRSADGRKRDLERTVSGTKREAERELSRLLVEVDEGRHVAAGPVTFGELLDRWLDVKRLSVEPTTLRSYEWVAAAYLRPALVGRVAGLRPMELDALYAALFARPLSARTVRVCHTVVRQSLEQARRWGLVARNAALDATPPGQVRREVTLPTAEQVRALPDAARDDDPDFGVYLWLLAATGCRRGEACALRWSDVDLERGELLVRRSIALVDGRPHEKGTKTHQARPVTLDRATVALLGEHRRWSQEVALALGVRLPADAYLFSEAGDFARPWRPDVCTNRFAGLRRRLSLPGVRLRDLRHFVATALGADGTPIATISARLGHRDKATTLNVYSHTLPAADRDAAEHLGSLFTGRPAGPSR